MIKAKTKEQKRKLRENAAISILIVIIGSVVAHSLINGKTTFEISNQVLLALTSLIVIGSLLFISAGKNKGEVLFRVIFCFPFFIGFAKYLLEKF